MDMALLIFFVAVTMLASICHGLWVLGTFVVRFFSKDESPTNESPVQSEKETDQDRLTTERYLRKLYYEGKIPEQEFVKLLKYTAEDFTPASVPTTSQPDKKQPPVPSFSTPEKQPPLKAEKPVEETSLEINDFLDEADFLDSRPSDSHQPVNANAVADAPPAKKRPLGSLLNAFMEEKNIRWGELISGLLIVGSAIGLVVSLWSTLKNQIPYLPALLFLLATAAIHGAGLYTHKRWKLESTSRGLLMITVLLVPLNFLAAIRLSDHRPITDPLFLIAISIGFAAFGWIIYSASRILVSFGRWQLLTVVMGTSAGQLIISRIATQEPSFLQTNLLAMLPAGCFILAMSIILRDTLRWKDVSDSRARELVSLGGLSLFSVLAPCWLLIWNSTHRLETFANLTPLVSVMEILLMGIGLVLHHRKGMDDSPHWSVAGSSIAIFSALMMLFNFAIAWPRVDIMIVLGIVNGICLTLLAIQGRFALCHIPALFSGAIAGLLGFHVLTKTIALTGTSQELLVESLLLGRSAVVFTAFAILGTIAAGFLKRSTKQEAARYYIITAGCFSLLSTLIAIYAGFVTHTDVNWSTLALFLNTIIYMTANWHVRRQELSAMASGLGFLTLQHALNVNTSIRGWLSSLDLQPEAPFIWGCLLHATGGLIFLIGLHYWSRFRNHSNPAWSIVPLKSNPFTPPVVNGSLLTSIPMVPYALLQTMPWEMHAYYSFAIMLVWITSALIKKSDFWFFLSQVAGTVGSLYAASAIGEYYGLWQDSGWSSPRFWLIHIMSVAIWNVLGSAMHSKKYSQNLLGALSRTSRLNLQPVLLAGSLIATSLVLFLSITPAIAADFEMAFSIQKIQQFAVPATMALFFYTFFLSIRTLTKSQEQNSWTLTGLILSLLFLAFVSSSKFFDLSTTVFGFSVSHSAEAFGVWSWSCLSVLMIACLPYINGKFQKITTQGMLLITYLIPFLCAGQFIEHHRTADALRWGLAIYALGMMLLILKSDLIMQFLRTKQVRLRYLPKLFEDKPTWRNLSMLGACLPLLVLTIYQILGQWSLITSPQHESVFSTLTASVSMFCVPILMLMVSSVCYAIHFRSPGWMMIGSHLLATTVLAGTLITISEPLHLFHLDDVIRISIYIGLAFAFYGLYWLVIEQKTNPDFQEHQTLSPVSWPYIRVHFVGMLSLIVAPYLLPFLMNLSNPEQLVIPFPNIPLITLLSLIVAAICVWQFSRRYSSSLTINGLTLLGLATIGFVTVLFWQHSKLPVWRTNLIMELGLVLICAVHTFLFLRAYQQTSDHIEKHAIANPHYSWLQLISILLIAFALRGGWADPLRPTPPFMITSVLTTMYLMLGFWLRKQRLAYLSLATALLGTTFVITGDWFDARFHFHSVFQIEAQHWIDLLKWLITTAAGISGCWLIFDLYHQKQAASENRINEAPAFQQILARILTCLIFIYLLPTTVLRTLPVSMDVPIIRDPAGWITLLTVTTLLIALLWDQKSRYCLPGLFAMGIAGIATYLSDLTEFRLLAQNSGLAIACYACLLGGIWSLRGLLSEGAIKLKIPNQDFLQQQTFNWLPNAVTLLSVYVMLALVHSVLCFEDQAARWYSVLGVMITGPALFAMSGHRDLSETFKKRALLASGVGCLYFGWALLPVDKNFYWLDHLIRLLEVVSILSLVTTLFLVKWPSLPPDWSGAIRKSSRTFLIAAGIALLSILISEAGFILKGIPLEISGVRIAVVSGALVALSAALILMAAIPKFDPFQFPLKRRMLYVYAAEIVLALLFLHIYLTMPELFRGYLLPYWPYIVIAIAFTGAGVGEFFGRIGLNVLSQPLQRTGAFLPILPALSFWIHAASRQETPVVGDYSMILLLIGIVYVALSLWRKSFIYTSLAALAGNGALWAFWMEQGQVFTQHPQLWLIPPALSVLIATHLNREKLSSAQITAIRYFSTITIYISSTGDMFIAGVADNLWLPVILCMLSVTGMLVGMMLRVRAFLYVGSSFLTLSIVSMIWHASQSLGHIWPWWAFGIGLGICILTLFGMFEKRKNEMLEMVGKLKSWDR